MQQLLIAVVGCVFGVVLCGALHPFGHKSGLRITAAFGGVGAYAGCLLAQQLGGAFIQVSGAALGAFGALQLGDRLSLDGFDPRRVYARYARRREP
jgi:uncharacterized membrane protein YeaQ/YmgE (transglycosylase-associated protein family)